MNWLCTNGLEFVGGFCLSTYLFVVFPARCLSAGALIKLIDFYRRCLEDRQRDQR